MSYALYCSACVLFTGTASLTKLFFVFWNLSCLQRFQFFWEPLSDSVNRKCVHLTQQTLIKKTEGRGVIHSNVHIHLLNLSISSKSKDLKFTKLLVKNILMAKVIEKWSLDGVSSKSRWRSKSKCGEDLRSGMWLCWQNCSLDPYKHTVF